MRHTTPVGAVNWILSRVFMLGGLAISTPNLGAQSKFVYSNDDDGSGNTVSAFSVEANGSLLPVTGSPFATGGKGAGGGNFATNRIVVGTGNFLFVTNSGSQNISVFSIDPAKGVLTLVAGSPFSIGATPGFGDISLAVTPDAHWLYAAHSATNKITRFSIAANGALSPAVGGVVDAGGTPDGIKVTPDGKFLAVALPSPGTGSVAMFSIANGALSPVPGSPFPGSMRGFVSSVDVNCASNHVFGAELNTGNTIVDVFNVAASGALTAIAGSPFAVPVGNDSNVGLLSPNDQFLFVTNQFSDTLTIFKVAAGGTLSLLPGMPFGHFSSSPAGMAMDQSGTFLYVAGNTNMIFAFSVAADGTLSAAPGSPFSTGRPMGLLSLAAFPPKSCAAAPPPPPPPPPVEAVQIAIGLSHDDHDDHDDGDHDGDDKHDADDEHVYGINSKSHGKIPVAILSNPKFDALTQVDKASLTFGHTGDEHSLVSCQAKGRDVNGDGLPDLICRFYIQKAAFVPGDQAATLKGHTVDHIAFEGKAPVHIH